MSKFLNKRLFVAVLLLFSVALSFSQTRNIRVNVNLDISQDKIDIHLNSQAEDLNHCTIQILDSLKKVVGTGNFPKATPRPGIKQWTENSFSISDLPHGEYTLVIFLGKEEMHKHYFSKDK
jgi:hypothetical protein